MGGRIDQWAPAWIFASRAWWPASLVCANKGDAILKADIEAVPSATIEATDYFGRGYNIDVAVSTLWDYASVKLRNAEMCLDGMAK